MREQSHDVLLAKRLDHLNVTLDKISNSKAKPFCHTVQEVTFERQTQCQTNQGERSSL